MTPADRLDAQLRAALREDPTPVAVDTPVALRRVLDTSARRRRTRRWQSTAVVGLVAAAAVGAALVVPNWLASGAGIDPGPVTTLQPVVPAPLDALTGSWTRTVEGAGVPSWNGTWSMTLSDLQRVELIPPAGAGAEPATDGVSYDVYGDRLRLDAFVNDPCGEIPGTYRWAMNDDRLVLEPVDEPCAARVDVFAGTWERSS